MKKTFSLALAALAVCTAAEAATVSFDNSVSFPNGGGNDTIALQKFDGSRGNLTGVKITLEGTSTGTARFESTEATKTSAVTVALGAELGLSSSDFGNIAVVLPTWTATENLSAFDGNADFGGTSGRSLSSPTASDDDTKTYALAADLAKFIGTGNLVFDVNANNKSSTSGGNLISWLETSANAKVTIEYTYDDRQIPTPAPVPLPAGMPLFAAALGLMAIVRRRG